MILGKLRYKNIIANNDLSINNILLFYIIRIETRIDPKNEELIEKWKRLAQIEIFKPKHLSITNDDKNNISSSKQNKY